MEIGLTKYKINRTVYVYHSPDYHIKKKLLLGIHGYGQSGNEFVKLFNKLDSDIGICAPEAISRFYWKGFQGNVVTSWMTKYFREDEINDYIEYLDQVYKDINHSSNEIVLLGFSQGATTLLRWLKASGLKSGTVFIIGNLITKEFLDFLKSSSFNLHVIYMDDDVFIPAEMRTRHITELKNTNLKFSNYIVKGKHAISMEIILLINKLVNPISSDF